MLLNELLIEIAAAFPVFFLLRRVAPRMRSWLGWIGLVLLVVLGLEYVEKPLALRLGLSGSWVPQVLDGFGIGALVAVMPPRGGVGGRVSPPGRPRVTGKPRKKAKKKGRR